MTLLLIVSLQEPEPGGEEGEDLGDEGGFSGQLVTDPDWPMEDISATLGQIGGVATDKNGNPHVLHRAGRTWEEE